MVGHGVGEDRRAVGRAPPVSAWVSFTAKGRPCSGPTSSPEAWAWSATAAAGAGALGVERDDRVELGVALLDPVEVQLEELGRRDLPGPYGGGLGPGGRVDGQVGHRRRPKIPPTTTPSTTSPAPTATPVRNSCCEPGGGALAGAVKTCPAAAGAAGVDRRALGCA